MSSNRRDDNATPNIAGVRSDTFIGSVEPAVHPTRHTWQMEIQRVPGFDIPTFDYIVATYPDTVTEVYTYKLGGSGGTTVATITVVYSDATKATLTSVTKT